MGAFAPLRRMPEGEKPEPVVGIVAPLKALSAAPPKTPSGAPHGALAGSRLHPLAGVLVTSSRLGSIGE